MKGASKVIMAATLVMVVTLAIVLGLVLVLLAELYCTLLLRRRRLRANSSSNGAGPAAVAEQTGSTHPPHAQNQLDTPRSYAPGVLEAPRSLFYPTMKEKHSQLHHFLQSNTSHQNIREIQIQINATSGKPEPEPEPESEDSVVYISNPIFVNNSVVETPFETPESSPSRLETGSGGSGEECSCGSPVVTPMKKLPAEASSVSLRCLGTSGSDSNGLSSSSSSGSPSTSPSW